jgi:acyl carrier protein
MTVLRTIDISRVLKMIIQEVTDVPAKDILPVADIRTDIADDSLEMVEIIHEVEKEFKISISDPESEAINTFEDLQKCVIKKIVESGSLVEVM